MTLGRSAPDGVEALITVLDALDGTADYRRPSGETVPWFMVTDAASGVNTKISDRGIYSVHTFHPDYWEAKRYAFAADDLILSLGPPYAAQERITLADGRIAYFDEVVQSLRPHESWYSDDIHRFIARYAITGRLT
ncbi:hypothetical protein HZU38_05335 [Mycolicibacterium vanbaalenii]|uniref:hypothetical protein n=1 Tax=Mycolicibacterium vanbaalenii TaxID=110539 RepID=UPI001F2976AA|nr:hypothetical protein [Mycolicibacterium vanbaalenii]UJL29924.1 hypothetical protein HZU38_05335 [Mycolicibacterium vanbaalenii]WND57014.1 hypothetical protein QQA43_00930 [Mycolicibacterium vanbaalenii]